MTDQGATPATRDDSEVMAETRSVFKLLSLLLDYPTERLVASSREWGEAVKGFSDSIAKKNCGHFLAQLDSTPLLQLQEEVHEAFRFQSGHLPQFDLSRVWRNQGAGLCPG